MCSDAEASELGKPCRRSHLPAETRGAVPLGPHSRNCGDPLGPICCVSLRQLDVMRERSVSGQNWKYKRQISAHSDCPPRPSATAARVAYRFVRRDFTAADFLPTALAPGARPPGSTLCCVDYSLSLFDTADNAAKKLEFLHKKYKNFHNRCGGCVAKVTIAAADGEATATSKSSGHFEFFEYANADLSQNAVLEREVVKCSN